MRKLRRSGLSAAIVVAGAVSACVPTTRTPDRLYPILYEMETIQSRSARLEADYYALDTSAEQAKRIRNEIVAQRMYAIDIQYTQYEAALTRESQEVGFAALTAAGGLTTASTLVASAATKTVLSAVATAVLGTKSHYESEILLAQTIRTIQKQMRASRNFIAANIAGRINQSAFEYPLAAALSDVEDYYNAGTLTTGVIDTSTTVGVQELDSKELKQAVTQATPEVRKAILRNAVIDDATAPMARPANLGVINELGRTDFERRGLTPALIRMLETMTCQPKTGKLTDALRAAVLVNVKRPNGNAITNGDVIRIDNQYLELINANKTVTCP